MCIQFYRFYFENRFNKARFAVSVHDAHTVRNIPNIF